MNNFEKKLDELFKKFEGVRLDAEKQKRKLTPAEIEERKRIKAEIEAVKNEHDDFRDERELRAELYGDGGNNALTLDDPNYDTRGDGSRRNREIGAISPPSKKDYRSLFGIKKEQQLDRGKFKDFNEFLEVVHSGRSDERLKLETRAMTTGVGSDGGFSVPEQFAAWLLDQSLESEIIRPRATGWPMAAQTMKVPGWDMSSNVNSLFGGLTAEWLAEGGTATEVFAKLRRIMLKAQKIACYTSSSNELIQDGISLEAQLSDALVKTIGFYLDYSFIQGSGAGQPLGIVNDPALITVLKEVGQKTNTVLYQNAVKMFARLAPQCMKNSIWIANQTTIPELLTMSISIGTAGVFLPAMSESNGKFYLLTRPVVFTEKCPVLGRKGDLIFCDPSQYTVGMRKEVTLDKSNAPGWLQDVSSYRAIARADGQGQWNQAIHPKNGDTLSWCVALEAR